MLQRIIDGRTDLVAAFHGHWQLCQFLVERGADANRPLSDTGETPLHAALCKANRPIYDHVVEILLANGANPNLPTKLSVATSVFMRDCKTKAETPLHRATAFGSERSIQLLLAYVSDEMVGCGAVKIVDEDVRYGEIKRVFVQQAFRRRGLAQALMRRLESHAAESGVNVIRLETGVKQSAAVDLYRKLGYVLRAPFGSYPADPLSVFMEKKLST